MVAYIDSINYNKRLTIFKLPAYFIIFKFNAYAQNKFWACLEFNFKSH